jgi:hypothetical protein
MAGAIWLRAVDAEREARISRSSIGRFVKKNKTDKNIIKAVKTGKKACHYLINSDELFKVYPRVKDTNPNIAKPTAPVKAETQKDETQIQVQAPESCTNGSSPMHPLPVIDDLPRRFIGEWENHIEEFNKRIKTVELYLIYLKNAQRAVEEQMKKFMDEIKI